MRALIISRRTFPAPMEQAPMLTAALADWRERHRSQMEAFEFFAGSEGGFGILNVPDEATLHQIMLEFPYGQLSKVEVYPILDGDQALAMNKAFIDSMAG